MQKAIRLTCLLLLSLFIISNTYGDTERWGRYEVTLKGPASGNPFASVTLQATFTQGTSKVTVNGFYDGDGNYKIRFMPAATGRWNYVTTSNAPALNHKTGSLNCVAATSDNHGLVRVWNTYSFKYDDGKIYYPFGTTAYVWNHQGKQLEEQTLNTFKNAPFNKVRMCVFPKYYNLVTNEPELYLAGALVAPDLIPPLLTGRLLNQVT